MTKYGPIDIVEDINALLYQTLMGIEEVLGANGLKAVLQSSGLDRYVDRMPPNDLESGVRAREFSKLNEAIEAGDS